MVLLGCQASPLLLQALCQIPFKRAELHLRTAKPFCLLQFDLQALMGWHFLLFSSLNYSWLNNTQFFFSQLFGLRIFCLSQLIVRDKNFVPCPFILLCKSNFSDLLSCTAQLATLHLPLLGIHPLEPLKFWSPNHEIFSVSFSQCYTQVKWENKSNNVIKP